jgi:hypothetical protein
LKSQWICEVVKELTAHRQLRTYAAQWIMVYDVARALGVDEGPRPESPAW